MSYYIHEETYRKIKVFKGVKLSFIAWICPLLKPRAFSNGQNVTLEGDEVLEIYFLVKGKAGFVLPKYNNTTYINIHVGQHFGIIDIVYSVFKAR